jgi:hypothetical protein
MKQNKSIVGTIILIFLGLNSFGYSAPTKSLGDASRPGRLKGRLVDEASRRPLPEANVMIEGTAMGASTDSTGGYSISPVPPGVYNVRYLMLGYETRVLNNVVVNPGRTTWQQIEIKSTVLKGKGVTVTAGYFQAARDAVVSNRSVDFEELRSDPGSCEDVQRVMQALPSVVSGTDMNNEIIVRGGIPGENLFLMDDIEIPNPNHFGEQGTSGGPINMLNPLFVQRIDFYAGAFPARYGDKASSAMDITLREGNRDGYSGHAYVGMAGAGAVAEGPIQKGKGSILVSGQKSYLDLILTPLGLTAVPHYYSLQSKLVYDLNSNNKLTFNALYGNDFIEGKENDSNDPLSPENYNWKTDGGQHVFGLGWRRLLGRHGYTKVTLSQVTCQWNERTSKNNTLIWRNHSSEGERTLKTEFVYLPSASLEMQLGVQIKDLRFNLNKWAEGDTVFIHQMDETGLYRAMDTLKVYDPFYQKNQNRSVKSAAYMQWKWHPADRWTLTAGLRGDYFAFIRDGAVDPRLGVSFGLTPATHLNLAVGQQSQAPNYSEITAHPLNRDLDYKQTRQAVFSLDHLFREDIRGTIEFFYKDYRRVPIGVAELSADPLDMDNGRGVSRGEGFAKGMEVFLQKKSTQNTHFTVSYAYSVSKARDLRNGRMYNWDFDYRHMFTAIGGVQLHLKNKPWYQRLEKNWIYKIMGWILPLGDEVEISCRWRYLGGRPYTRPVYHPEYQRWLLDENVAVNANRYPAYHRLDLRIDRRFMFDGWNIVTYFDVMNVYNRKNVWEYYYKNNGSVETENQFSFMPVGGITVEF